MASQQIQNQIFNYLVGKDLDPEIKVREVIGLYEQLHIKEITEALANDYITLAFSLLRKVSVDEKRKKELISVASSLIGRDH